MSTLAKIENRPVSALKPHPLRARMPKRQKDSLAFAALSNSIHCHGINEPLAITPDGQIIDGLDRWHAAKDWQLETVPCIAHADDDAPRLIVESLTARKQMTRGAAVYSVIPLLADFFKNCEARRCANIVRGKNTGAEIHKNLQKDQCFTKTIGLSSEELSSGQIVAPDDARAVVCAKLGVDRETLRQARKLWLMLNEHGADFLRSEMGKQGLALPGVSAVEYQTHQRLALEPRLLAGELGVGAALAGMAGKAATQGTERVDSVAREAQALDRLFRTPLNSLPRVIERVLADADPDKLEEIHAVAAEIERLTLDALEAAARAHAAEQRDLNAMAPGL